ncbi:acyl-CoA thioesterase [Psychromarinibacter halotolerans]|uniref:Acyl-CoA thioesterase n=1 Tax=Psychromarinibacter halotolerans TaxID=1775175 RepID=A0ABV7GT92_9RHOB|nr:acyl-CoA thioesterase [Psychromarinibacter halotolerans]MDF0598209.1 acyl-CoA thioesterase [Psychromarinibacter halotolerans]
MGWFLSYKAAVDPSHCDALGHMNVSRYFAACSDAGFALQGEFGLTARDMREGRRMSFAVVHADSDFRSEVHAGETIFMESGIAAIGGKSMTFRHRLFRADGRQICFETRFRCALMNLVTRKSEPVPDDIRAAAQAVFVGDD